MCCRYYMEQSPELRPFVETAKRSALTKRMTDKLARPLISAGEVRPTDMVPVVALSRSRSRSVFPMIWGYSGFASPLINARAESAGTKPAFRDSWNCRRCIVPASWYYEWEHLLLADGKTRTGAKYLIQPKGKTVTFLAGLYRIETRNGLSFPSFVILTREPGEELKRIHNRMPVILPEEALERWLDPGTNPETVLALSLTDMTAEKAAP